MESKNPAKWIIVKDGMGREVNAHKENVHWDWHIFDATHPEYPALIPDTETPVLAELRDEYFHPQLNKWCWCGPHNWDKLGYDTRQVWVLAEQ